LFNIAAKKIHRLCACSASHRYRTVEFRMDIATPGQFLVSVRSFRKEA